MTYAEYNTDENFDKKESSLEELVKLGKSEGKTKEEIKTSLSPKWQKSKYINQFDNYYGTEETPKTEQKPSEEKVSEKVVEQTAPKADEKKDYNVNNTTKDFMDKNNAISFTQEDAENKRQSDELGKRWDARLANIDKMTQSMKNIDDKMVEQLPTFMLKRYSNGEFGDPKSSDAKLRLAHFMINSLGSKLKNASNAAMVAAGKSPLYADTMSDYDKYQQTNLAKGMENRWKKYEAETQSAIDLAKQGGMSEESITDSIATISSNNRLQSAFNQMNEREKVFALNVLSEIGNRLGNMNDEEFVNTLFGMSAMGQDLDYKEAAAMLVYRTVKDPEKRNSILSSLGFDGVGGGLLGGIGGALGGKKDGESETGTTLEDGTKIDPGKIMSKGELEQLRTEAEKLGNKFYNGEMTEEEFRKEYAKLEGIMKQHGVRNAISGGILSQDAYIKQIAKNKLTELSNSLYDLNDNAKNYTKDEYLKKYDELKAQAVKWGISEKDLKSVEKEKDKALKKTKK